MFDVDHDGDGRANDSTSGYSSLVAHTRRSLAVSYALAERLRTTGHRRGDAAAPDQWVVDPRRRVSPAKPLAAAA